MDYLLVKWVHILSAAILFGTGIGTAFFMFIANRGKDLANIYFTLRHVVIADGLFTTPAVVVQLATGLWLLQAAGYSISDRWIAWSIMLFLFAGACWLPVVRIQIMMRDIAKAAFETGAPLPERYWRLDKLWIGLGALAFPTVAIIFFLMVAKP